MDRSFEMLAYGLVAAFLVVGSLYALARYAESDAPAAPVAVAQAAYRQPPPPHMPAPQYPPAPPAADNVVRTATRTYHLNPASPSEVDSGTYDTLRRNCYETARLNGEGEFPGLQQAACARFADFARRRGWTTGPLPGYASPRPMPRGEQVAIIGQSEPVDAGECATLYQQEQSIEAAMRAGYQEPLGNWYRARKAEIEERLWALHCPRR